MKKILSIIILVLAVIASQENNNSFTTSNPEQNTSDNQLLINAYKNRQSDIQIEGTGIVHRILADDTKGSQHQRFTVKTSTGQTILIAHNIDLAPRIDALREGDKIAFYGEYEWNEKGGIIHWTHHDPRGSHANGWLKYKGSTYQ